MTAPVASRSSLINAPLTSLWEQVSEPHKWPHWDKSLRTVELLESVKVGAQGKVFPISGEPIPFKILKISGQKEIQFSLSSAWLTRIYDYRLIEMAEGCVVTINLHCVGSLGAIANRMLGSRLTRDIEQRLGQLKQCIEPDTSQSITSTNRVVSQ